MIVAINNNMPCCLRWVVLTVTWFLSAGLKWGQEAIDCQSQWFHFLAWALPAVKTVAVLIMKKVEGDVLTGACYVGLWDVWSMRWLVLTPLTVYFAVGAIFLILGLVSLVRIRTIMKKVRPSRHKMTITYLHFPGWHQD